MSKTKKSADELQREQWAKEAENAKKVSLSVFVYSNTQNKWIEKKSQKRSFDSVILPAALKKKLVDDITEFNRSEDRYLKLNTPYRRGYFLYGPPGTGKTSICMATATVSGRPIYVVPADLNIDAIISIPAGSVVLFEDADKFISTKDTAFREVDAEPVPLNTSYPTINADEHNLWMRAIRSNEEIMKNYKEDYAGLEANFDPSANGGVTLMDSVVEGVLTDMKAGYAEPRKAKTKKPADVDFEIEYQAAETEEEFQKRRQMYKNIIREANRLRQEHYDSTRFDQEKVGLLLQIIDGALTPYNTIFLMTTNKRNDIQSAMIRAGRMDVALEIGYMDEECVEKMFDRFGTPADKREEVLKRVRQPGRALCLTAAELQGALL